ncbi:MAG: zinc ribbon domain-containing protein [Planctomycetota bacterium]
MIKFRCHACQKKIGVKPEYAGRAIKCPSCEARLTVPTPAAEPKPVASETSDMPDLASLAALEAAAQSQMRTVEAPGRTCPSCGATVSENAVLCTNCGYSFKGGKQQISTQVITEEAESTQTPTVGGMGKMVLGLGAASVVAVICCVVWLMIMVSTGYQVGLIAWVIGGLVGLTAGLIGRNPSPIYCGFTALIACMSIIGAKLIVAATFSVAMWGAGFAETIFEDFSPERANLYYAVMDDMLQNGEFSGEQQTVAQITTDAFFGQQLTEEPDTESYWESYFAVDDKVEDKLASMSGAEQEQTLAAAQARYPQWVGDPYLYQAAANHLVDAGNLSDELTYHARQTVLYQYGVGQDMGDYNDDYGDWMTETKWQQLEFDLNQEVSGYVVSLDTPQREQLITQTKAEYPTWVSSYGESIESITSLQSELEDEGISDSFGANFLLTFRLFDIIFLGLALTTAYSVAYKQGA